MLPFAFCERINKGIKFDSVPVAGTWPVLGLWYVVQLIVGASTESFDGGPLDCIEIVSTSITFAVMKPPLRSALGPSSHFTCKVRVKAAPCGAGGYLHDGRRSNALGGSMVPCLSIVRKSGSLPSLCRSANIVAGSKGEKRIILFPCNRGIS